MKYAEIIIMKRAGEFDDPLAYGIPEEWQKECAIGREVFVPLRGVRTRGLIVGFSDNLPKGMEPDKIKDLDMPGAIRFGEKTVELAKAISVYYCTSLTRALKLIMPANVWKGKSAEPRDIFYASEKSEEGVKGVKQKEVIKMLDGGVRMKAESLPVSKQVLKNMVRRGILREISEPVYRKPDYSKLPLQPLKFTLTGHQEEAVRQIISAKKPVLVHGITGSGKTEIYLRLILKMILKGKQSILLVPEIALTPQMIDYFKGYFGDHIALFHSMLSDGERAAEWWKAKSGHAVMVIGSRSAIFAPVPDLGMIIVDEEHEWTYKQESAPYYQAQHVGEIRAKLEGAHLVLGSATPRLESFYKAKSGEYEYMHLPERINKKDLPIISIVDLRDEFKNKNFSIFSRQLYRKIADRLAKNQQVILFVNQRGMARAVTCRDCGYTEECPNCSVSLKYHRQFGIKKDSLVCHYCGFTKDIPLICPSCRSQYIKHVGIGTERVEEEVKKSFPGARVIRADSDTTSNKEGFAPIYKKFKEKEYDILVGTQMVAKGLDFENVTLIGIMLADIGLHIPDFRSHERLFQLIIQVSGRCGRGENLGEVVLQTYQPEHFAIVKAANYEYDSFAENELKYRKKLSYPPFERIIKFTVTGTDQEKLKKHVDTEILALEDICKMNDMCVKIYSAPAIVPKISNRFYHHVLIKAPDPNKLFLYWKSPKYWRIDVDPVHTV
jgi:primosomal protein N' (replication factor Y)